MSITRLITEKTLMTLAPNNQARSDAEEYGIAGSQTIGVSKQVCVIGYDGFIYAYPFQGQPTERGLGMRGGTWEPRGVAVFDSMVACVARRNQEEEDDAEQILYLQDVRRRANVTLNVHMNRLCQYLPCVAFSRDGRWVVGCFSLHQDMYVWRCEANAVDNSTYKQKAIRTNTDVMYGSIVYTTETTVAVRGDAGDIVVSDIETLDFVACIRVARTVLWLEPQMPEAYMTSDIFQQGLKETDVDWDALEHTLMRGTSNLAGVATYRDLENYHRSNDVVLHVHGTALPSPDLDSDSEEPDGAEPNAANLVAPNVPNAGHRELLEPESDSDSEEPEGAEPNAASIVAPPNVPNAAVVNEHPPGWPVVNGEHPPSDSDADASW
jgi:hypothetical protein